MNELQPLTGRDLAWIYRLKRTHLIEDPTNEGYLLNPATGKRFRRLNERQRVIAEELFKGSKRQEAARKAGMTTDSCAISAYISSQLRNSEPFCNYLIDLFTLAEQSNSVTKESHLSRLDQLGRAAEANGKFSAAIAAEVARGRVAGLYANDRQPEDKKVLDSVRDIDERIKELTAQINRQEREVEGKVVSTQKSRE